MASSTSWLTHQATIMLLIITWRENTQCNGITVDPPKDLVIRDPGHLGLLEITWNLPDSLINRTECKKMFQLEYFNTYTHGWTAIRTGWRTYSAQFDLMKDVRVRVYTLLSGPCTSGGLMRSKTYTEVIQKPLSTGAAGTEVQDFVCVNHLMKYLECNWTRGAEMPANSRQHLYFWHDELGQTEECPRYVISSGVRSGCNFTGTYLPDFTDINFCLNGTSPEGPLRPTFITLQIQNHVKPATTEKLFLQTGLNAQLELCWESPVGVVPGYCLEWEVEHNEKGPGGKTNSTNTGGNIMPLEEVIKHMSVKQVLTSETSLNLSSIRGTKRNCFRVRSKLTKYCAERSFWSEWSHPTCTGPGKSSHSKMCFYYRRRSKQVKEPNSLLTSMCAGNSDHTEVEA